MKYVISVAILFAIFVGSSHGEPSYCYSCYGNSACNDPLNTTAIGMENCLDLLLIETQEAVCYTASALIEGSPFTSRGCAASLNLTGAATCDFVEDMAKAISNTMSNFQCSICTSDLCNSSNSTNDNDTNDNDTNDSSNSSNSVVASILFVLFVYFVIAVTQ